MIPPSFGYAAPRTVAEAAAAPGHYDNARVLAGGQSLIPAMRFRLASPAVLVDLDPVEGLSYIREQDGWLRIGARTRESELEHSSLTREKYPLLTDAASVVSAPVVRNTGTVGGNLAGADPGNDHPAVIMLACGAQIVAVGPGGERLIPVESFFLGLFESALAPNEILTEVRIPTARPRSGDACLKPANRWAPASRRLPRSPGRASSPGTTAGCKRAFVNELQNCPLTAAHKAQDGGFQGKQYAT